MSLLRSSVVMASGTVLSRVTGLVRDIAMTAALGFYIASDAYSLGNTLPNIISILVAGGALNAVFIPQLVRHIKDDADGGHAYADRLLTVVTAWLIAVTVLAMVFAPQIVGLYATADYTPANIELATAFARLCLPQIVFYGLFTMWSQVLNARQHFALPMFAPILNNIVAIATFGYFMAITTDAQVANATLTSTQITVLGLGTTLGVAAQTFALLPVLRRVGYHYRPRFDLRGNGLGKAGTLALWTMGLVLVNQLSYVVVTRLATHANVLAAEAGVTAAGLTTYQKAHLVFMLPHSVITVSVVTALLPQLSRIAHEGRLGDVGAGIARAARTIGALVVPIAAALFVLAPDLARVLFGFGAATADSALATGRVVQVLVLGLLPFTLVYVLFRGWYALEDTRSPFVVTLLINAVNLGLSLALFAAAPVTGKVLALGGAYAVAYWVAVVAAWVALSRRLGGLETGATVRALGRITLAALGAALAGALMLHSLGEVVGTAGRGMLLAVLTLAGMVMAGVYVGLGHLFGIDEVRSALALLRRRGR